MSKHTPGPWTLMDYDLEAIKERFGVLREDIVTITNTTSPSGIMMVVAPYVQGGRSEWRARNFANAHVIAAAPVLLDACEFALAELLAYHAEEEHDDTPNGEIIRRLRAAIAATEPDHE